MSQIGLGLISARPTTVDVEHLSVRWPLIYHAQNVLAFDSSMTQLFNVGAMCCYRNMLDW